MRMRDHLIRIYVQMAESKFVVAIAACADGNIMGYGVKDEGTVH